MKVKGCAFLVTVTSVVRTIYICDADLDCYNERDSPFRTQKNERPCLLNLINQV